MHEGRRPRVLACGSQGPNRKQRMLILFEQESYFCVIPSHSQPQRHTWFAFKPTIESAYTLLSLKCDQEDFNKYQRNILYHLSRDALWRGSTGEPPIRRRYGVRIKKLHPKTFQFCWSWDVWLKCKSRVGHSD